MNVLKGEMRLVGPRPHLLDDVERYDDVATRRLLAKPGMAGLWQVSGRSDLDREQAVRLDLYYVENWSLASDLRSCCGRSNCCRGKWGLLVVLLSPTRPMESAAARVRPDPLAGMFTTAAMAGTFLAWSRQKPDFLDEFDFLGTC